MIKIDLVCHCSIEYKICCNLLELDNKEEIAGRSVASKTYRNINLIAISAGPGKIQSASATQLIIDIFRPHYIFDVGGAGALSRQLKINDIICVRNAYEYDVWATAEFSHFPSDLIVETAITKLLPSKTKVLEEFSDWVELHGTTHLVIGDIASGEKNVIDEKLKQDLHEGLRALACNWETSAVLKTAKLNNVPAFSFRVITDTAGKNMKEQLERNWEEALKILYGVLKEFIFHSWLYRLSKIL